MSREITISPRLDGVQLATLSRQAASLDRLLDNPYSGPQPIAQTGVLEQVGGLLWNAAGLTVDELLAAIAQARVDKSPVRLVVTDAVRDLPWELLYHQHPDVGFLGRHPWCVVARRFTGDGKKAPTLLPRLLRLLLFIASPEDLDPERSRLDFEREEELLFTALDGPLSKGELVIDVAEDGCLPTLLNRVEENRYHAVIVSMHGAQARNSKGEREWGLLFEDQKTGQGSAVAGSTLAAELERLPLRNHPGLLIVSACRSAKAEESADSIASVARRLHESSFERVLGMRLSVLDGAASAFSAELFRRLALGESVGRAVTLARDTVAQGAWLKNNEIAGKGELNGDPFAQWTLPVLLDRTVDGPVVDMDAAFVPIEQPASPAELGGDGMVSLPTRAAFVGRRSFLRQHLRAFLDGKTRCLLLTGPGGVGKTTLAGLFARILRERNPGVRLLGFRAPFVLDSVYEILRREAFDGSEEPTLLDRLKSESDVRGQISCLLTSLARRKRACALVLDNLESLQQLQTLDVSAEHEDSFWFVRTVCDLPAPTRVLLTGRYSFHRLPAHVQSLPVPDAPYGDVLLRMNRLRWPSTMDLEKKRQVYAVLGGNHRAIAWTAQLLTDQPPQEEALLEALGKLQVSPATPEDAVAAVRDAMRQNLLFSAVRQQLTPAQDRLLRAACLFRVPVNVDGLLAIESQPEQAETNHQRLIAYSLLEPVYDLHMELGYFVVPPIVRELLGEGSLDPAALQALHRTMGYYHRFQGQYLSKRWSDDLEAIHHFRQAEEHEAADALAERVCGFYYRISNYTAASKLAEEIINRDSPPPLWWALNHYGLCQLALGFLTIALAAFERALPVALTRNDEGATLNNLSQISHARGDYETALKYLEQSLQIQREIGDKAGLIATLHNMAHIALQARDFNRAMTLWSEALSLALETRNAQGNFHVASTLGTLLARAGDKDQAAGLLELAVNAGKQAGFPEVEQVEAELHQLRTGPIE